MKLYFFLAFMVGFVQSTFAQTSGKNCHVAIDIGHTQSSPGSISARGIPEFRFNEEMANILSEILKRDPRVSVFVINGTGMTLQQRTKLAADHHASIFLSLHHDSVQPQYLSTWLYEGQTRFYSDKFHGFSLFVSKKNSNYARSLALATSIGNQLLAAGFNPTLHHAEQIPGESRILLSSKRGIYLFDDLIVLKTATMPAVLLECGVIVNRQEELHLVTSNYRFRMMNAVAKAVEHTCSQPTATLSRPQTP